MIKFTINQDVVKPVINKRNIKKDLEQNLDESLEHAIKEFHALSEGKKLINEMEVNFNISSNNNPFRQSLLIVKLNLFL